MADTGYFDGATEPTDVEKAWMAGFMDGEGCITILRQRRPSRPSPAYRSFVTVTNTMCPALEPFVRFYGGYIRNVIENRTDKRKVKWADAYTWYCPVGSVVRLLTHLRPYLLVKGGQAVAVLEFQQMKRAFERTFWPGQGGGSAPLSAEEIAYREGLRIRVQLLNSKGQRARLALEQTLEAEEAL